MKEEDKATIVEHISQEIKNKEKEFHNHRMAFYINEDNRIAFIKKGQSHIEYFNEIGHSEYINVVTRGYILDDHVMLYIGNDFEIPYNLTIKTILEFVSSINKPSIKWVGLGCIMGKVGEEWTPKITIKLNTMLQDLHMMQKHDNDSPLDKFKSLQHISGDMKQTLSDWGYAPNLYFSDEMWHVDWISCEEGDSIKCCTEDTAEEAIEKAYNWFHGKFCNG